MKITRGNNIQTKERGGALLEFCFVGPVMLLILAAVCELGAVLREAQSVTYALRESSRIASTTSIDVPNQTCDYYQHAAEATASQLLSREGDLQTKWNISANVAPALNNRMISGRFVTVTITATRIPLDFFPGVWAGVESAKLTNSFRLYQDCI